MGSLNGSSVIQPRLARRKVLDERRQPPLNSPVALVLTSEIRWTHAGARRMRCQLELCSGWVAPPGYPHSGPAGLWGGWDANLLLTFQLQIFFKGIPTIRTTHAPPPALAPGLGRACSFSPYRSEAVGGGIGRAYLFSCSLRMLDSLISLILKSEIGRIPVGARRKRCQLEQCSGSAAPAASPHGGSAGVGGGGMHIRHVLLCLKGNSTTVNFTRNQVNQ